MRIADTSAQDQVIEQRGNRLRWFIAVGVLILLLILGLWMGPAVKRWASSSVTVPLDRLRVAQVEKSDLVRDVSAQGRVVASVSPTLFAPDQGTITLLAEAGMAVTTGQVLAEVDSPELKNRLAQEQATYDSLAVELERQRIESKQKQLDNQKNIDLAQVALTAAERERRRAEAGFQIEAISEIEYEKSKDDLDNARLAHQHAVSDAELDTERLAFETRTNELQLGRQQFLVEELQRQVEALRMRSPVDGIVGNLLVDQKSQVAENQAVMAVVDLSGFEVEAEVPESYADDLGLGMSAEVLIGNQAYSGMLVSISPEVIQNQVSTRIRFVDGMPAGLRQNQRLTTRILMEEKPGVLIVPRGQFLESGGGRVAYVLGEDGTARRRSITIGARSLGAVEIASGVEVGETVVISSLDAFRGADIVRVTN